MTPQDQPASRKFSRLVTMTEEEWDLIDTGLPDTLELLTDVRNVMWKLCYAQDLDQPWVNSMLRLAGRAVMSMEEKEFRVIDRLDAAIRQARKVAA